MVKIANFLPRLPLRMLFLHKHNNLSRRYGRKGGGTMEKMRRRKAPKDFVFVYNFVFSIANEYD
ncbi:MAG: hypothetical protein RRY64_07190, partial [Oscillospiraceae bacterium]